MDIYGEQPPVQPEPEAKPEPRKTQEQRLVEAIHAVMVESDDELDPADILIDDNDDETLTIRIDGYRIDEAGRIVLVEKEYEFAAEITVTFTVNGTVTATSDIEADEYVEEALASIDVSNVEFDSDTPLEESGWGYSVDVDVRNVREV